MKRNCFKLYVCILSVGLAVCACGVAQVETNKSLAKSDTPGGRNGTSDGADMPLYKPRASLELPVYKPKFRGAPVVRVAGSSRADGPDIKLLVIAPEHVGLTTQEQPSLYWYNSRPVKTKFELTIVQKQKAAPLLEFRLDSAAEVGIHQLPLADHNIKLAVDTEYRWIVALVFDQDSRSRDVVASGMIKRITPGEELKKRLAGAKPNELPFIYAEEGIWYDAISSLGDLIEAHPGNDLFHKQRAALLQQVGLGEAAMFDTQRASAK
jgi:hypothetical protein